MDRKYAVMLLVAVMCVSAAERVGVRAITGSQAAGRPCPSPPYVNPVPAPDKVSDVWQSRKRYRLVIGAGDYSQDPSYNRAFVTPTAELVDQALLRASYTESLGLLTGARASKANITTALERLSALPEDAIIVLYYVGHGVPSPANDDVVLSVADEKVSSLTGLPVKSLLAKALGPFDPQFRKIPRILFILETCNSGAAIPFNGLLPLPFGVDPKRFAFLSATGPREQSYPLKSQQLSAFGYFIARALDRDWACADMTPDGALMVSELGAYLESQLRAAQTSGEIAGVMTPDIQDRGLYSILTYDGTRVANLRGYRDQIVRIYISPQPGVQTDIVFGGGKPRPCVGDCRFPTDSPEAATVRFVRAGLPPRVVTGAQLQELLKTETHALQVTVDGIRPGATITRTQADALGLLGTIRIELTPPPPAT